MTDRTDMTTTPDPTGGEDNHDEPIVLDNGPARLFFGKNAITGSGGDTEWRRDGGQLLVLIVERFSSTGVLESVLARDLRRNGAKTVVVHLQDKQTNPTRQDTLTFVIEPRGGGRHDKAFMKSTRPLVQNASPKGLLTYNGFDVFVKQVRLLNAAGNDIKGSPIEVDVDPSRPCKVILTFEE